MNPVISEKYSDTLIFTFQGELTGDSAKNAINTWQSKFAAKPLTRFNLIWDCRHMDGYEPMARVVWQKALQAAKGQIKTIWLISDKRVIRAGATLMSMMTRIDIKAVSHDTEIQLEETPLQAPLQTPLQAPLAMAV